MPRAIWSGSISFGLVNVPIRMYSAIEEKTLHFNLLHEPDDGHIGYQKVCKAEDAPVPDDEIVRAYELKKGSYVVLDDADFDAVKAEGVRSIEIAEFVPYEEIDSVYFERTYFLGPQNGAERVYALLREAMARTELAGIAKYVMRGKQQLGCLRVRDGVILLERMFFHDEIRDDKGIAPGKLKLGKEELEAAEALIGRLERPFDPKRHEDTYRRALLAVIRAKQKGKTVQPPEDEAEAEEPADLLAALRASVDAAASRSGGRRRTTQSKRGAARRPARSRSR